MTSGHLCDIQARDVKTKRLTQRILHRGPTNGIPVVFIHGNFSSSTYFEELMVSMPQDYYCIAVDLRGYGDTETAQIDATRGARDWSDDLHSLLQTLKIERAHFVGWSLGAAPIMQLALDYPAFVWSLTLVAPVSPFGFGGTRDEQGQFCNADAAGSGAGMVAKEFVQRLHAKDHSRTDPASPLNVIYSAYFYKLSHLNRESHLLEGSLKQALGRYAYPGDSIASSNWPYTAPGNAGPINAISAKHYSMMAFASIDIKPRVLWIRGNKDDIVSNTSSSDIAILGQTGLIPDWPGMTSYPPQPMVDQTRYLLEQFRSNGGYYEEVVLNDVGHSPFIEAEAVFLPHFLTHLTFHQ